MGGERFLYGGGLCRDVDFGDDVWIYGGARSEWSVLSRGPLSYDGFQCRTGSKSRPSINGSLKGSSDVIALSQLADNWHRQRENVKNRFNTRNAPISSHAIAQRRSRKSWECM